MLTVRRDDEIHEEDGGWFTARWHFSFGGYHDPDQMGVGALRVFNDDRIVAGAEWPMHPHRDIESLTYVVEGLFEHADSLGNGGTLRPGGAQVMRFSSRGAMHSERNGSDEHGMRFIQFWILPSEEGLENSVQQQQYHEDDRMDQWLQIMGPAGENGLDLAQDATVLVSSLSDGSELDHDFGSDRAGYLYVIDGAVRFGDDELGSGDAIKVVSGRERVRLVGHDERSELILVDVPADFDPVGIWASR
ncbi:MAG: pirin family protein [Nitriliruptorales bacterium]|nr:pirin family protein [Nitriliruptorales bacterium]